MSAFDLARVRDIERRAFAAWPAARTLSIEGWLLFLSEGFGKRANSLNPFEPVDGRFDAVLGVACDEFARAGLSAIVRLTPLAGAEPARRLSALGWRAHHETFVLSATLPDAVVPAPDGVVLQDAPDPAWLDGVAAANGYDEAARASLARITAVIRPPAGFGTAFDDGGRPIAWGYAVADRGVAGFFGLVTAEAARGRGAARRMMDALSGWARRHGAPAAYLQVEATNAPARALYRSLGFALAYRYDYWTA